MALTSEQVSAYEADGYLSGIRIADKAAAEKFRQKFDELEAREGREKCRIGLLSRHTDEQFIWDLAVHPRILNCIEALIGPDIMLLGTHFFCKYGPDDKFVAWHQDVTYWGLEPPDALTAWYAVDDSDRGNGCMRVIPGSHRRGVLDHGRAEKEGNLLSINQEVPVSKAEEERAGDILLKSGEISIHHGQTIHGSLPNPSSRRRCGLTLRFIHPRVKQVRPNSTGQPWTAILVRGEDREKHFEMRPAPFPITGGAAS